MDSNNDISFEIGLLEKLSEKVSKNPTDENKKLLAEMKIRLRELNIERIISQTD